MRSALAADASRRWLPRSGGKRMLLAFPSELLAPLAYLASAVPPTPQQQRRRTGDEEAAADEEWPSVQPAASEERNLALLPRSQELRTDCKETAGCFELSVEVPGAHAGRAREESGCGEKEEESVCTSLVGSYSAVAAAISQQPMQRHAVNYAGASRVFAYFRYTFVFAFCVDRRPHC